MKQADCILTFCGFRVVNANFAINKKFDTVTEGFELEPSFYQSINHIADNRYSLMLSVMINSEKEGKVMPFDANVEIEGVFEIHGGDNPEALLRINATSILFPYLRAALSSLTLMANVSPVILPAFNITKLFEEKANSEI